MDSNKMNALISLLVARNGGGITMVKLLKLLYYVDFTAAAKLGRPVTNASYYAWEMGPVCIDVYKEAPEGRFPSIKVEDRGEYINITNRGAAETGKAFSAEELGIIDEVWGRHGHRSGNELSHLTHQELPWQVGRCNTANKNRMDYDLADMQFSDDDEDEPTLENRESSLAVHLANREIADRGIVAI